MRSQRIELSRRVVRWFLPAAALALVPKCLLCVLAYAGISTALGLTGPEICDSTAGSPSLWTFAPTSFSIASGLGTLGLIASLHRLRSISITRTNCTNELRKS